MRSRIAFFSFTLLTIILSSCTSIRSKTIEGRWRYIDDQSLQGNTVIFTLEFFPDGTFSPRKNGECPSEPYSCQEKWRFVSDDQLAMTDGNRELIYKAQIKQNAILLTRTTNPSETLLLFRCYSNDTGVTIACGG